MSDNKLDANEKKKLKEAELKRIRTTLVDQLKNGKLVAVAKTTSDIAGLLTNSGFFKTPTPERKELLAYLAAHGVPEDKVRVYILGDASEVTALSTVY